MAQEQKLEEEIKLYENVAKENKGVDVAALMMNALQRQDQNQVSSKAKKWAYLISVGLPPFGLLFALKYYFSDESDAKRVANICVALTAASILSFVLLANLIFSGSGASLEQIQQIKPSDVMQLTQ